MTNWNYGYETGSFWISADDYVKYFDGIQVGYYYEDYHNNYLEVESDDGSELTFDFTLGANAGRTWIGVAFYSTR